MRLLVSAMVGFVIALGLFLLMQSLIAGDRAASPTDSAVRILDFVRVDRDDVLQVRDRTRPQEPPPPPTEAPPPPRLDAREQTRPTPGAVAIDTPRLSISTAGDVGPYLGGLGGGTVTADSDVIPVARFEPRWPREALINRTEGWVVVEFTILEDGTVQDAVVVESHPGHLFDRSAVRAIERWRFRPRVIDGVAVQRRAQQRIDFILSGDSR